MKKISSQEVAIRDLYDLTELVNFNSDTYTRKINQLITQNKLLKTSMIFGGCAILLELWKQHKRIDQLETKASQIEKELHKEEG